MGDSKTVPEAPKPKMPKVPYTDGNPWDDPLPWKIPTWPYKKWPEKIWL